MATLRLEIGGPYAADEPNGGAAVIAELVRYGADGRAGAKRTVTVLPSRETEIGALAAGTWEVRVLTIGGATVTRDVALGEEDNQLLRIPLSRAAASSPARSKPGRPDVLAARPRQRARGGVFSRGLGLGGTEESFAAGALAAAPAITRALISAPQDGPGSNGPIERWAKLAAGVSGSATTEQMLNASETPSPLRQAQRGGGSWAIGWPAGAPHDSRVWIEVNSGVRRRIHCVPVPWTQPDGPAEVMLGERPGPSGRVTQIMLLDQRFAGIVAYLASGAVATAAAMVVDQRTEFLGRTNILLRGKTECPLGAAAAGYVLIGSANLAQRAPWHEWIGNLSSWYPWIPDGAILLARLRLMTARSAEEAVEALPPLREAISRGLPYYAVGLGWMLAAMAFFEKDEIVQATRPLVAKVAAALDMDEPFTTLDIDAAS